MIEVGTIYKGIRPVDGDLAPVHFRSISNPHPLQLPFLLLFLTSDSLHHAVSDSCDVQKGVAM
jgi:hypothetical protein